MSLDRLHLLAIATLALVALGGACTQQAASPGICSEDGAALYERRIEPLLLDDRPKTCNQCHLSGVDLSLFVRETPCETMACMVELDVVDLESPDDSLILSWIDRAMPDSELITETVIAEEREAMREWIAHTAECGGLEACAGATCGPAAPDFEACEVSARRDDPVFSPDSSDCSSQARENVFLQTVYAWRGRCFPCHYLGTDLGPEEAPRWIVGGDSCGAGALASRDNLFGLDVVDWDAPAMSRLLLKPLAEDAGGVVHGGHDKFDDTEDPAYVAFLRWIEYEKACLE